jgi:riboflavin transporter FmnP
MRRSRWVSLVALFTALAVVLNGLTVPAPYAGFLLYGVWEVPVLLALLMLGFRGGLAVAALNGLALEFINPGGLPTGPLYNLVAEVSMFAGVLGASKLTQGRGTVVLVAAATSLGAAVRTGVMTAVNWIVLPQPYPVGFSVPQAAIPGLLLFIGVFNATVSLYVVPGAFGIRKAIASRSRLGASAEDFTSRNLGRCIEIGGNTRD